MRMALRYVASTGSKWILMTVLFPVCMLSGCVTSATVPGRDRDLVRTPDGVGVLGEPRIEPSSQETIVEIPGTAMAAYPLKSATDSTEYKKTEPLADDSFSPSSKPACTCRPLRL